MTTVVLDTSALIRLFVPDGPVPQGLEAYVADAEGGAVVLEMPELAWAEVAEVLRKKEARGFLSRAAADAIVETIQLMPIRFIGHGELIADAMNIARDQGLTVYDGLFFALAKSRRATLITADERLAKTFGAQRG